MSKALLLESGKEEKKKILYNRLEASQDTTRYLLLKDQV